MNEIIYAGKHLLTYTVTRHAHTNWEFIYCTSGDGILIFDDFTLPYQEGNIALIPPYTPHANQSTGGFTNIHVNIAAPTLVLKTPTIITDDGNRFILNAFNGAFYQYSGSPGKQTPLLSAYGELIVRHLAAHLDAPKFSSVVREIVNSITNNYPDANYELDVYLRSLPFSYDYLRKLFKKELGITPHKFLMDMRLQTAAESLSSDFGDAGNISEIAHMCGFREPLYFSRVFKNKYGVSPSAYQQRQLASSSHADSESMKIILPDA